MRALRKVEAGPGARLEDVPIPSPDPGEVLIQVEAVSICGSDLHIFDWNAWAAGRIHHFPMTFGHEVAGRVAAAGPRQVIAVEPNEFRLDLAKTMGADVLIDPIKDDPVAAVRAATDGHGAEVVLEMSGVSKVIDQGTRMLDHGGRLSLLGLPVEPVTLDLTDQVIFKEARIFGVTGREPFRT